MLKKKLLLTDLILLEIKKNSQVTEKMLAKTFLVSERTIRRHIRYLKMNKKITMVKGKKHVWQILD